MENKNDFTSSGYEDESNSRSSDRPIRHTNRPRKRNIKLKRFILFAVIDLLLIGIGLIVFSLFHHVIPKPGGEAIALPTPSALQTEQVAVQTDAEESVEKTAQATEATPSSMPYVDYGMWGEKFADKFTTGEVISTQSSYQSEDINVSITKVQEVGLTYFIADIYVRDIGNLKTMLAQDTFGTGYTEKTVDMAIRSSAVIALSGDNYGGRQDGIVIRNGLLYREASLEDVLIMNNDGSMQTFSPEDFDLDTVKQNGAWQLWSFGPLLLTDGFPMEEFNSNVNPKNPRSAIGYFEPGHYCFIVVDGRQGDYSNGMTLQSLSQVFFDLGCTIAYNLDGGQTAVMAFMGQETNTPYDGGRKTSDIIFIAENEG